MKHHFSLLLCLFSIAVHAQDGLFLQPSIGFGTSNIANKYPGTTTTTNSIFAYRGQISVGYQVKKLAIITGLEYLRTGDQRILTFENNNPPPIFDSVKYTRYFYHIALPVYVSYQIKLSKKLAIVPLAGFELTYNLPGYRNLANKGSGKELIPQFDHTYHLFSVLGSAQLNIEYALSKRMTFTAGPSFSYMLTNMDKNPSGAIYIAKQNNYAALFNVGMKYSLSRKTKPAAVEKAAH